MNNNEISDDDYLVRLAIAGTSISRTWVEIEKCIPPHNDGDVYVFSVNSGSGFYFIPTSTPFSDNGKCFTPKIKQESNSRKDLFDYFARWFSHCSDKELDLSQFNGLSDIEALEALEAIMVERGKSANDGNYTFECIFEVVENL